MNNIKIPAITKEDNRLNWGGFKGASFSLAAAELIRNNKRPIVIITPTIHEAEGLQQEIRFFNENKTAVTLFPDWETLPYDHFSPHQDIISERLATLSKLPIQNEGIYLASASTLMHRLIAKNYLLGNSLLVKLKDHINIEKFKANLINAGYRHVSSVMEHGEFTVRGSIIDLFPMGRKNPYRIELFDEEVESIRSFDSENQRSIKKIDKIELLPAREYPLSGEAINHFRQQWRQRFHGNPLDAPLYQQISQGGAAAGIEYYLPLFYEQTSTFFDYVPSNALIVLYGEISDCLQNFWQEIQHRYEQLRHDIIRPLCQPQEVYISPKDFFDTIKPYTQIKVSNQQTKLHYQLNTNQVADISINHRANEPLGKLKKYLQDTKHRVLFSAESTGRRETLLELLNSISITPKIHKNWSDFLETDYPIGIVVSPLEQGIEIAEINLSIITESQLFGEQVKQRRYRKQRQIDPNLMIRNLTELTVGAPIVHINHGVGRYLGLQTIQTNGIESEYLTLGYADNDKIYVPVTSLHLISRYTGADSDHAPLQKLGSKQWDKIKRKTAEQIRDVAAELLDLYGRRLATEGFEFKINTKELQMFKDAFAFEETPDQNKAINDVLQDMQAKRCMDRLVCGDVGFGKTEVAMRAAFVAVQSNKQVAVLVPTTLLATQHLQNFKDRFADWPIKIAGLSRMQSQRDQMQTLKELENGKVDIIIGTHKLLSEQVKFKDLGLLIIDEEQRFGVRQKERITSIRAHIDILTLTATPIPRTLNMALAGTRDLSIIATPPTRRLSVKTFIHEFSEELIREAISRETMRGGQVYFLHNDVATIEAEAEKLRKILPHVRLAVAHGQMRERQLEQVMSDFYHQRFNVLVCSTIVESGIDIPSANTIVINRADRFGLSQLHQLRGRVGRSHHQAYAYLLTPAERSISKDAEKRLDAIAKLGELGVGFSLATHDLEIRGAGELLGEEQSGQIHAIGFTLYMELLEEAVNALKSGREPAFEKPLNSGMEIDLSIPALLPKNYVDDVHIRLTLYKRLAHCKSKTEIQELKSELIDRFGLLPEAAQNLFNLADIRLTAEQLGITQIESGSKYGHISFNEKPNIKLENLILLIQKYPKIYQLQGSDRLRFQLQTDSAPHKINAITELLKTLA